MVTIRDRKIGIRTMADLVAKKEEEIEKVAKEGEEDGGDDGDDGPAPVRIG